MLLTARRDPAEETDSQLADDGLAELRDTPDAFARPTRDRVTRSQTPAQFYCRSILPSLLSRRGFPFTEILRIESS